MPIFCIKYRKCTVLFCFICSSRYTILIIFVFYFMLLLLYFCVISDNFFYCIIHRKDGFAETSKYLARYTDLKIILFLDYQNNYIGLN